MCSSDLEQTNIEALESELGALEQQVDELKEEHGNEGGLLEEVVEGEGDKRKITSKAIKAQLNEIGLDPDYTEERKALEDYAALLNEQADLKSRLKAARKMLEAKIAVIYGKLTEAEIKTMVVDDKWLTQLAADVRNELDHVSETLTARIRQLADRYAAPLPQIQQEVEALAARAEKHLKRMGFVWK